MLARSARYVVFLAVVAAAANAFADRRIPVVKGISPSAVSADSGSFTLTVAGRNFNRADTITWNGAKLSTILLSNNQAQAQVPATAVATAGSAGVGVWDSETGLSSNLVTFTITPSLVAVAVSPTSASLPTGGTKQFTASVSGTTNTAVSWSATGGSISSTGLYTAPSTACTQTVKAVSAADPTKSANVTVSVSAPVTVGVSVAPASTTTTTNGTAQFNATVSGATNTAVSWSATGGTISSTGLYTAPSTAGTYTVTAVSAADPTKSASATATVTAQVSVSISPNNSSTTTSGNVQLTAAVTGTTNAAVTWSVASGGGTVSISGLYTAPSTAGSATVRATSVADPSASALAYVTVNAPVTMLLSASPTSISFGSVVVGGSVSKLVTLTNTGNSAVTVSSASMAGSGFGLSGLSFPFTVAANSSQTANVGFTPSSSGTATGSVSFVSNSTNSPATVALSGSGTAPLPHSVTLTWQASTSSLSGYNVYRSGSNGGPYGRLNSAADPTSNFVDSSVQSGQTYYYVVTVVDSSGLESGYSNQVAAVIPTP